MRWKRQLTISPSGLFLPPADVEDEEGQKDKQDDASYTYAEDEVDIHTLLCKRNRDGMERRGPGHRGFSLLPRTPASRIKHIIEADGTSQLHEGQPPGGRWIMSVLKEHRARLSPPEGSLRSCPLD